MKMVSREQAQAMVTQYVNLLIAGFDQLKDDWAARFDAMVGDGEWDQQSADECKKRLFDHIDESIRLAEETARTEIGRVFSVVGNDRTD